MAPRLLDAKAALGDVLPSPADGFGLLSYNVLLPNSAGHGWWITKYYEPTVPPELRAWPHRQALLRDALLGAAADLVCLQETTPEHFADDWAFLREAGYDHAVHRKGDLRCATFWRRDRWTLAAEPRHLDRVLLTRLTAIHARRDVHVANVHLKAGPEPARRLRQVADALEQIGKRGAGDVAAVLCGDFNSQVTGSALERLLRHGEVGPDFREATYPDVALTSRAKKNPLGPFEDAYDVAYGAGQGPPTLLLPGRAEYFFGPDGALSPACAAALRALFARFADEGGVMDRAATERWITAINGRPDRGSEWDKAQEVFARRGAEQLLEADVLAIYEAELREGKPWGVLHDLLCCGALTALPPPRVLARRYDQIHATPQTLALEAVRHPLDEAHTARVFTQGETLPNAWHPSDHLPVSAVYRWR